MTHEALAESDNQLVLRMPLNVGGDSCIVERPIVHPNAGLTEEASPTGSEVQSIIDIEEQAIRTPVSKKFAVGLSVAVGAVMSVVPVFLAPTGDYGSLETLSFAERVQENADQMVALGAFTTLSIAVLTFASIRSDSRANRRVEQRVTVLQEYKELTQIREEDGEG